MRSTGATLTHGVDDALTMELFHSPFLRVCRQNQSNICPASRAVYNPPMPSVVANGLNIHYTEHGSGQPLVLLHTGTATGQMWERQVSALERYFRVIVP